MDERVLARELSSFGGLPAGARCVLLTGDRIALDTGHVQQRNAFDFLAGAEVL